MVAVIDLPVALCMLGTSCSPLHYTFVAWFSAFVNLNYFDDMLVWAMLIHYACCGQGFSIYDRCSDRFGNDMSNAIHYRNQDTRI